MKKKKNKEKRQWTQDLNANRKIVNRGERFKDMPSVVTEGVSAVRLLELANKDSKESWRRQMISTFPEYGSIFEQIKTGSVKPRADLFRLVESEVEKAIESGNVTWLKDFATYIEKAFYNHDKVRHCLLDMARPDPDTGRQRALVCLKEARRAITGYHKENVTDRYIRAICREMHIQLKPGKRGRPFINRTV